MQLPLVSKFMACVMKMSRTWANEWWISQFHLPAFYINVISPWKSNIVIHQPEVDFWFQTRRDIQRYNATRNQEGSFEQERKLHFKIIKSERLGTYTLSSFQFLE